jgi:hypothetical protein
LYRAWVQRLDYSKEGEDVRGGLDRDLGVSEWRLAGVTAPEARVVEVDGEELRAPTWWRGDEEASQSFLGAMGVTYRE